VRPLIQRRRCAPKAKPLLTKANARAGLKATLTMQMADRGQRATESKTCVCCGFEFERATHTRAGKRQLRQPMQWKRQRFCSAACTRQYRLEGSFRESLPSYLAELEPVKPRRQPYE
jgi:hypothetical protein